MRLQQLNQPSGRPVVMVVGSDASLLASLEQGLPGYELIFAEERDTAIAMLRRHEPPVVIIDLEPGDQSSRSSDRQTSDESSTHEQSTHEQSSDSQPSNQNTPAVDRAILLLAELMSLAPATRVIGLAEPANRLAAIRAIAQGAHDCSDKPVSTTDLAMIVKRAFRLAELEDEARRRTDASMATRIEGIVSRDPALLRLSSQIERLAQTTESVVLIGEGGAGKHLFGRALHALSPRAEHRFVVLHCASAGAFRLDVELFGMNSQPASEIRRAFPGKLELANGGTLYLDEISRLPHQVQTRLLYALRDRKIMRSTTRQEIRLDVRLVCASREDLHALAKDGRFNADLLLEIAEVELKVPPLRDRAGDAALLAHSFVKKFGTQHGRPRLHLSEDALQAIDAHPWPENVRELENCIHRAVVTASGRTVHAADLGLAEASGSPSLNLRRIRDEAERAAVLKVMARADGNVARAAELLGVSRPTLYDLLNRFGLR